MTGRERCVRGRSRQGHAHRQARGSGTGSSPCFRIEGAALVAGREVDRQRRATGCVKGVHLHVARLRLSNPKQGAVSHARGFDGRSLELASAPLPAAGGRLSFPWPS